MDRVVERIVLDQSGCWLWDGSTNKAGYGLVTISGTDSRKLRVHRVVYEHFVGPIPDGLTLDHLCRVRHCVNFTHLEPVTRAENVLRGVGVSAVNATKTHCKYGHAFTPENTYVRPGGTRECRTCVNAAKRERYTDANQSLEVQLSIL